MFHPVGPQPPSVYWRRRLLLLGAIAVAIVLFAITVKIAAGGGDQPAAGSTPRTPSNTPPPVTTHASVTTQQRSSSSVQHSTSPASAGSSRNSTPAQSCLPQQLAIQAVVGQSSYHIGDKPVLELQVTNTGAGPCVQDLADKQVELRVYNGESRVWGSHDCQIEPGTNDRTLAVNHAVRVAITWSGLSSEPNCAGTRQRVGAGTYTLYAALAGKTGKAAQFTIG